MNTITQELQVAEAEEAEVKEAEVEEAEVEEAGVEEAENLQKFMSLVELEEGLSDRRVRFAGQSEI